MSNTRTKYLESLLPKDLNTDKYYENFTKYACYMGNGVYSWRGLQSTNTRDLFLMGVLKQEKISYKEI